MPKLPVVFLDDGGVLNDNSRRGPQWVRLVGEFFPPRLGGAAEAWSEANRVVAAELFRDFDATLGPNPDFTHFERRYYRLWLPPMCQLVGVDAPADDELDAICREANAWITRRVHAAIPGAGETVRWLREHDYRIFTASGEDSIVLDGYLTAMGICDCFGDRLYGPDLVGVTKSGPWFHERVFADAGVDPADALVIDDSPKPVAWARGLGARVARRHRVGQPGRPTGLAHPPGRMTGSPSCRPSRQS